MLGSLSSRAFRGIIGTSNLFQVNSILLYSSRATSKFELTDETLECEFNVNKKLAQFGKDSVYRTYRTLINGGFIAENAFLIVKKHPYVVRFQPSQLMKTLEMWRSCQFSNTQFIELMVQCPELLEFTDSQQLKNRFADIESFAHRNKNVWRLLMASPNILTDNIKMVYAKADYLFEVMDVDVSDACKSGVFASSLQKIKCRHMLLVRLGIYKPKPKNPNPLDPNKNPRIARIMDTPDDEFARKICQISMAEVNAFNAYYIREIEDTEENEDDLELSEDEDSDDDNESSNFSDDEYDPKDEQRIYDPSHRNAYRKHLHIKKSKKVK